MDSLRLCRLLRGCGYFCRMLPADRIANFRTSSCSSDISKACLHADVLNDSIYVELPGEMNMPNMCGRLLRRLIWDPPSRQSLGRGVH